ncbi:hypothetical protein KF728_29095 [Candidatus Obscuribacterales bacterium]|nr:hypothetical protein [Candidatus Obscuribacterales bacterium]
MKSVLISGAGIAGPTLAYWLLQHGFQIASSYVLAGELKRSSGDHRIAFAAYEKRLRAFIEKKQKGAKNFGKWFAPDTQFAVFLRNQITKLFAIPFFADKFVRDTIADELRLPDYS